MIVIVDNKNWADLADIGQFSMNEELWCQFDNVHFENIGLDIVNNQFNGNIGVAYKEVVGR